MTGPQLVKPRPRRFAAYMLVISTTNQLAYWLRGEGPTPEDAIRAARYWRIGDEWFPRLPQPTRRELDVLEVGGEDLLDWTRPS